MLKIIFGDCEHVAYGPTYFKYNYELSWLSDPFVQKMIEAVDHSRYVEGSIIESEVLGPIPPERLSGGVQTLIMIYERPEKIFDATSCGPNCAEWLLEIGKKKDVTVNLNYFMPLKSDEEFCVYIENAECFVHNYEEYAMVALDYL